MPVPLPSRRHPILRARLRHPWWPATRHGPVIRRWLDNHGYITPHFTWASYACTNGTPVPQRLRRNAIRLHWKLERMRHLMGDIPMKVDGPYRTGAHNRSVGGALNSRHTFADAADFFAQQIDRWVRQSPRLRNRTDVVALAERVFFDGGVGNETSGTLHVDARGFRARFITWVRSR